MEKIISSDIQYTLLFSDQNIKNEDILEDINSLLSIGEIPSLFKKTEGRDEFQNIREKIKDSTDCKGEEQIYAYFL